MKLLKLSANASTAAAVMQLLRRPTPLFFHLRSPSLGRLYKCLVKYLKKILFFFQAPQAILLHKLYTITVNDLIDRSDYELFKKVCCTSHSIYHLLPPYRTSGLRVRSHPFQVPLA